MNDEHARYPSPARERARRRRQRARRLRALAAETDWLEGRLRWRDWRVVWEGRRGVVAPLRGSDNRSFDYQIGLRANYFFGPTSRARNEATSLSSF